MESLFQVTDIFWIPDIFLDRARTVRTPTLHLKPASVRVYRDSRIRWTIYLLHCFSESVIPSGKGKGVTIAHCQNLVISQK